MTFPLNLMTLTPEIPNFIPSFTPLTPQASALPYLKIEEQMLSTWNSHNMTELSKYISSNADLLLAVFGFQMTPAAFLASQEMYMSAFPDLKSKLVRQLDFGNGWVVEEHLYTGAQTGSYLNIPPTGKPIAMRGVVINRFEGGLNTYLHSYWDQITLLTELGVFPPSSVSKNCDLYK
jgi:hypothetical protein